MNTTAFLVVASIALPLLLAFGLAWRSGRGSALALAPWAAVPALAAAFFVPVGSEVSFPWLFLGSRLGLDETGRVFLFFTALLWLVSGWFAQSYLADDSRRARFFGFFLLALAGNLGLVLAHDAITFYVGFALMSFASYGLVVHNAQPESLRAGRVYLALVVLGELMLFAALTMMAANANSLLLRDVVDQPMSHTTFGLLLLGFGIKAGALPLHVWLPLAHPAAPVPASAVLSGAMIKAGLLGWMRFLPIGQDSFQSWGALMVGAGLAAALYGALVGVTQSDPKAVLAYSSISQMGLITIPVGVALMMPAVWPAAQTVVVIYALHHALAKGSLFLGVGVASHVDTRAQRRWLLAGLLVPALALIGAPFTSGALAKSALKASVSRLPDGWAAVMSVALPLATVGTTLLMARFLWIIWSKSRVHGHCRAGLWVSWVLLLAAGAASPWMLPLDGVAPGGASSLAQWWSSLWPVILGLALASMVLARSRRPGGLICPKIPAGDWLAVFGWLEHGPARWRNWSGRLWTTFRSKVTAASLTKLLGLFRLGVRTQRVEDGFRQWPVAGVLLMSITAMLYLLLRAW
jgi:formate hydrogenlyase subunit 3/multisubunit Na+/H+ antiporter MnhD subunit